MGLFDEKKWMGPVITGFLIAHSGIVQSHSADTFTVVIMRSTPNSSQILYNDSVIWHNTDSRENITHRLSMMLMVTACTTVARIGFWILSSDCNSTNENESEDLKLLSPYGSMEHGVLENIITRYLSDGTTSNGTIFVTEDTHRRMQLRP